MDPAEAVATPIKPRDRLSFALFLVVSLHATVVLGVGFVWHSAGERPPTIEVTLAQHQDWKAPDDADFIAQADQLGSGSADDAIETTTLRPADFNAQDYQEVLAEAVTPAPEQPPQALPATVTTVTASEERSADDAPVPEAPLERPPLQPNAEYRELTDEIASLDARLDSELQTDARGPRIRRLTSVSARRSSDANYLHAWTRQVEAVGNLHYPEEARRRQLFGDLRLLVVITADGALQEVSILNSSGHQVLDDAAVRIVQLAAPFPPFPDELRREADVLEIIRTWQFRRNQYSSSS